MATDMFDIGIGGAQPSPIHPQSPVTDNSQLTTLQGIQTALQGVGQLFAAGGQTASQKRQERLAQEKANVMSSYGQRVVALDAAVEQGKMTAAESKTRLRALYNQTIANYPSLTEDLTAFHKGITGAEGLGDAAVKGTAVDQQYEQLKKDATANGWVHPGMTPDQIESATDAYQAQQKSIGDMKYYSQQLEIVQKKASIQAQQESIAASRVARANAQAELQIKRNKMGAQAALSNFAVGEQAKMSAQINQLQQDVDSGKLTREAALARLQAMKDNYAAQTMKLRGVAGGDYVDSLSKPLFDQMEAHANFLSGKIGADVMKTQVERAQNTAMLPLMQDPQLANLMAASKLLGGALPSKLQTQVTDRILQMASNNQNPNNPPANPTPHTKQEGKQVGKYMDSIRSGINSLADKDRSLKDPKGTWEEIQNHVNQVLAGTGEFSSSQRSPKQLNQSLDFLASPEFLKYQKMGGRIDDASVSAAAQAVSVNYTDKLIPTIQEEWEKAKTVVGVTPSAGGFPAFGGGMPTASTEQRATSDAVEYVWSGSSITFRPTKAFLKNPGAVAKAQELNKSMAPLINRMVRADAHMKGTDNYSASFKQYEKNIFGE